ncbi:AMP-binding protein [Psychromicrobium sp. YIM B11713]|uniref:AMP-binding protein n=1 Tax=Psychromicrobium sp. YIM B11713 TaxID=3145233 RepID=UPI00374F75E2
MQIKEILTALSAALAGEGPAVCFDAEGARLLEAPEGIAVVIGTSGSTGTPKRVMLGGEALAASSFGTALKLQGEGQWLLALPLHYVAGVQVLVRSLFAGTYPEIMAGGFSPGAFITAAASMTDPIRYTSLVPTQLSRLLEVPEALPALRRFNAILLGGAPASPDLLQLSRESGVSVVTTYGSAETCGGCVYDGEALDGVEIALREDSEGRQVIWLGGPTIAAGYLGDPERSAEVFQTVQGLPWYRTSDLGEFDAEGRLRILGRVDDVLITGGLKVSAELVAAELRSIPGVREAFVTGLDDPDWGQKIVAAISGETEETALRQAAAELLEPHALPKTFLLLHELPLLPQGKVDRQRLIELLRLKDRGE